MRYASWTYNLKLPTHPNGDAVLKVTIRSLLRALRLQAGAMPLTLTQAYRASLSSGINHW
jgi:hypothetical protein